MYRRTEVDQNDQKWHECGPFEFFSWNTRRLIYFVIANRYLLCTPNIYIFFKYHAESIKNVREAASQITDPFRPIAIALDTKGPEVRTGLINGVSRLNSLGHRFWVFNLSFVQSGTSEVELRHGALIRLTTDPDYYDKCDQNNLFVDYPTVTEICKPGNKIYIDDGLISVVVKTIGK